MATEDNRLYAPTFVDVAECTEEILHKFEEKRKIYRKRFKDFVRNGFSEEQLQEWLEFYTPLNNAYLDAKSWKRSKNMALNEMHDKRAWTIWRA